MASGSEVELPPNVEEPASDGDDDELPPLVGMGDSDCELVDSEPGDIELPPSVGSDDDGGMDVLQHCTCRQKCFEKVSTEAVDAMRAEAATKSESDRTTALFIEVQKQVCNTDGTIKPKVPWLLQGSVVCKSYWTHAHSTSHRTLDNMKAWVKKGHITQPPPLPKMPSRQAGTQLYKADAFFLGLYTSGLAEPMATEDKEKVAAELKGEEYELVDNPSHPLWDKSLLLGDQRYAPKKYLTPGTFEDLWMLYCNQPDRDKVSKSTLHKAWWNWRRFMPFRNIGQGKRCKLCAVLSEERAQATSEEERQEVARKKGLHVEEVKADRAVNVRGNKISQADALHPSGDGIGKLLKITIDGMDQAKFRIPRNMVPYYNYCWMGILFESVLGASCF